MRAVAAILVTIGLLAVTIPWLTHQTKTSFAGSDGVRMQGQKPSLRTAQSAAFPKPPSFAQQDESPELRALRRRLEGYYLTDLGLEQAVPLSQALQRLLSRARELNHLRQPVIDALALAPAEARTPTKVPEPIVRLPRNDLSLMDALRLVAAQAQCEIRLAPPGTIGLRLLPKLASSKLVTHTLRVRTDFGSLRTAPANHDPFQRIQIYEDAFRLQSQTRQEVRDYKAKLESIKEKQVAELIAAASNSATGIHDPKVTALHTAYLADQIELRKMEQLGAGPDHPNIVALKAEIENKKQSLEEAAQEIRKAIESKLSTAAAILAKMETVIEETKKPGPTQVDARGTLEEAGVNFPEQTAAVFDPAKSLLIITHTETAMRQIVEFLGVDSRQGMTRIHADMKVLEFSGGHALENRLMDSASFAEWLKEQNGQEGVSLLATPSITTRSGQNATVEVMRDVVIAPEGDGESKPDWQGTRINIHPTLEGEVVRLAGSAEVRRPRDAAPGQLPHTPAQTTELISTAVDLDAVIPPGQTALFSLSENADGPHLVGAIRIQLIDPSGQVLHPGGPEGK
jgi:hypothetical protein